MSSETPNDREQLAVAIKAFSTRPLADAARELFALLGYGTERTVRYGNAAEFLDIYDDRKAIAKVVGTLPKNEPVLLQQLTSSEIEANSADQLQLDVAGALDLQQFNAYLFLAFPLLEETPTRTRLAELARVINKAFEQPLLVLFRHGEFLSIAITYRRTNKVHANKDVVERKVTLIKDIRITAPHPGHVSILKDFALRNIAKALRDKTKRSIRTFADLDAAWRESLSTQLLNERFYRDIANWYFHARQHAKFPKDAPLDDDGKPSLPLIRLLTRMIFCWFLKEKELVPEDLFDTERIQRLLKNSDPKDTTYYTAILQNLFFATLNTEMDKPGAPPERRFVESNDKKDSDEHMVHSLWRHADQIADHKAFEKLFRPIPFLNGGLFECLDDRVKRGRSPYRMEVRIDGFASDPAKQPKLPNFLFFGAVHQEDLSEAYGDNRRKKEQVYPLLSILRRYKFTLTENTPIEEEVALDPELLGHVFENLLAAFNPETGTVARKATGSFYTPRVVVDWMVDQALLTHLEQRLPEANRPSADQLKQLVSWEDGPDLNAKQRQAIVDAVHGLKSIDPACGSGAFLMGLLQKLVHILKKVDKDNSRWRKLQEDAAKAQPTASSIEASMRSIALAFSHNNDDYGRKLYLIENGIFGVDIQPVAVQIAKLRFFISLIVDQAIDRKQKDANYGILALPNLETQLVAANSLLGLESVQDQLSSPRIDDLKKEVRALRHEYFNARSYGQKKTLRRRDEDLREELATELADLAGLSAADAERLAAWNPFDTNTHAQFFNPAWMYGLEPATTDSTEGVFDVVISNPPYVRHEELKNQKAMDSKGVERPFKDVLKDRYACYTSTADLYVYFFERSFQLLKPGGTLSTITSNKYFRSTYGQPLRTYLIYATRLRSILDFGDAPVFTAIAYPCILVAQKTRHVKAKGLPKQLTAQHLKAAEHTVHAMRWEVGPSVSTFPEVFAEKAKHIAQQELQPDSWQLGEEEGVQLLESIRGVNERLIDFCKGKLLYGIKTGLNELKTEDGEKRGVFVIDQAKRDELIAAHPSSKELIKPLLRGRDLKRWKVEFDEKYLIKISSSRNATHPWSGKEKSKAEKVFASEHPAIARHLLAFRDALSKREDQGDYFWELRSCDYYPEFEQDKIVFPDIAPSPQFAWDTTKKYLGNTAYICIAPKYTLAILNSAVVDWFYRQISNTVRGGYLRFIRQYVEQIPIPKTTEEQQVALLKLVEAQLFLNDPKTRVGTANVPLALMTAYLQQWLNGLVYELYFPGELQGRSLRVFDITEEIFQMAGKEATKDAERMKYWQSLFEKVYDPKHPLRDVLLSLRSLEVVRQIEINEVGVLSIAAEPGGEYEAEK